MRRFRAALPAGGRRPARPGRLRSRHAPGPDARHLPRRHPRHGAAGRALTWHARPVRDVGVDELPLVVRRTAVVDADRALPALADDSDDSATRAGDLAGLDRRERGRRLTGRGRDLPRTSRSDAPAGDLPRRCHHARLVEHLELTVRRHRVRVLLAQEPLFDEHVDARRKGARVAPLPESDRAGVLLAAEDEFGFALALDGMPPRRHGDAHQHRHDGEADEEAGHGVAPFAALRALTL